MPRPLKRRTRLERARERMYHELIFESAEHVFAERGFDAAAMAQIAREAGVSLKTLYATFPGKRELYAEIQRVRTRELLERVVAPLAADASPVERLAQGVRAYVRFLVAHPAYLRLHLREGRAWPPARGRGEETGWRNGIEALTRVVREGIERGLFHPGDPELLALSAAALMQVHVARLADDPSPADAEPVARNAWLQLSRLLCKPGAAQRAA